ncbi:hypothetical protein KEM56_005519 [Ascosphaera pollenicola]|nr:hypothetical protein KEM56_005519 [Ascosphaera pollenicola]
MVFKPALDETHQQKEFGHQHETASVAQQAELTQAKAEKDVPALKPTSTAPQQRQACVAVGKEKVEKIRIAQFGI